MDSVDLTEAQREQLFAQVDARRRFHERLHARMVARGFPPTDPLLRASRAALLAVRELALTVNDGRRKGECRRYLRAAKSWPPA